MRFIQRDGRLGRNVEALGIDGEPGGHDAGAGNRGGSPVREVAEAEGCGLDADAVVGVEPGGGGGALGEDNLEGCELVGLGDVLGRLGRAEKYLCVWIEGDEIIDAGAARIVEDDLVAFVEIEEPFLPCGTIFGFEHFCGKLHARDLGEWFQ